MSYRLRTHRCPRCFGQGLILRPAGGEDFCPDCDGTGVWVYDDRDPRPPEPAAPASPWPAWRLLVLILGPLFVVLAALGLALAVARGAAPGPQAWPQDRATLTR